MPYPVPPGPRIAYDVDGSVGLIQNNLTKQMFDIHPTALKALNSERNGMGTYEAWADRTADLTTSTGVRIAALIFPHPLHLLGVLRCATQFNANGWSKYPYRPGLQVSKDTTNGIDGTWEDLLPMQWGVRSSAAVGQTALAVSGGVGSISAEVMNDYYRRAATPTEFGIETLSGGTVVRNVKGIRTREIYVQVGAGQGSGECSQALTLHLYGTVDTGSNGERLAFWRHDSLVEVPSQWFDWGDVPTASSADKSFRVKNLSLAKTANSINVTALAPHSTTTPSPEGQMLFSADAGVTWATTLPLFSLSPGAVSGALLVRRTTPLNATLSNWSPRVAAEASSWT